MKAPSTSTTLAEGFAGIPEDVDLPGLVAIRGAAWVPRHAVTWSAEIRGQDANLGAAAAALTERMARSLPRETTLCLTHGTFHDKNIVDCGDGPGVIDWERSGLGPCEVDAGTFLACMTWRAVSDRRFREAMRASVAFRSRNAGRMDERALAWHEAAGLLSHASRSARRDNLAKSCTLLERAERALAGEILEAPLGDTQRPAAGHVGVDSDCARHEHVEPDAPTDRL